ncbi:MAG: DUF6356 family protein [Rhizomicrobium sp.]
MLKRLFLAHPHLVGETYLEHQSMAFSFSLRLFAAALACFVHALIPCLFECTASGAVRRLHDEMGRDRVKAAPTSDER